MRSDEPVLGRGYDAHGALPGREFSDAERALLTPHFTNLDRPVFALVNLPETVKGALFARYSRYSGDGAPPLSGRVRRRRAGGRAALRRRGGRARRAQLYERVFLGYGDDSIAQVGGAHLACEWVSNILTKVLQRGRLAAYLEQSTRYIPYDQPIPGDAGGGYRYYRDAELGPEFGTAMDELFAIYSRALPRVEAWAAERWPRGDGEPEGAWRRSIRAKALDLLRGLLPAATLSHVGIFASGQAYEQLLLRLMASPLPEARDFGEMILRRAAAGDAELRRPGRAARTAAASGSTTCARGARRPRAGSPGSASTAAAPATTRHRSSWSTSTAPRRTCSPPACSSPRRPRRPRSSPGSTCSTAPSGQNCWARWSASGATAATAPAAASRRCATASRSSPTTAASATCSATGC